MIFAKVRKRSHTNDETWNLSQALHLPGMMVDLENELTFHLQDAMLAAAQGNISMEASGSVSRALSLVHQFEKAHELMDAELLLTHQPGIAEVLLEVMPSLICSLKEV